MKVKNEYLTMRPHELMELQREFHGSLKSEAFKDVIPLNLLQGSKNLKSCNIKTTTIGKLSSSIYR